MTKGRVAGLLFLAVPYVFFWWLVLRVPESHGSLTERVVVGVIATLLVTLVVWVKARDVTGAFRRVVEAPEAEDD